MRVARWVAVGMLCCGLARAGEEAPKKKSHAPGSMFGAFSWQKNDRPWYMEVAWYLPSRGADLLDIVGIEVGAGIGVHANIHATRYLQLGFGREYATRAGLMSRYPLVVDVELEDKAFGWKWEFDLKRETLLGAAESIDIGDEDVFKGYYKEVDPAAIGLSVFPGIVGASAEIKPHEIVDFILGIFTVDSLGDDY